jgi:hypothetical protein
VSLPVPEVIALRLRTLRDIEGVLGSFVVGERGELLGRDVTAACGSEVLALVGGRLQQLCNAFASADIGGAFESTTLYFPQYKLHIRALANVLVVAVVSAEVNLPALKMAMNMLGRSLMIDLAAHNAGARESRVPPEAFAPRESRVPLPPLPARESRVPPEPLVARESRVSPAPLPARESRPEPLAARDSRIPPSPLAARDSRVPVDPRDPRDSQEPGFERVSHETLQPSREPPLPAARESGVPPRSYRGTRVAH